MVNLSSKAKNIIKEDLKPYLEKDDFKSVVDALSNPVYISDVVNVVPQITEFLYDIGIPLLKYVDEVPDFFFEKSNLTSITIPSNIRGIGTGAFKQCDRLTDVVFENGVRTIDTAAFAMTPLRLIDLPDTVDVVGAYAFGRMHNSSRILDVYIHDDVHFHADAFRGSSVRLHVPERLFDYESEVVSVFLGKSLWAPGVEYVMPE